MIWPDKILTTVETKGNISDLTEHIIEIKKARHGKRVIPGMENIFYNLSDTKLSIAKS